MGAAVLATVITLSIVAGLAIGFGGAWRACVAPSLLIAVARDVCAAAVLAIFASRSAARRAGRHPDSPADAAVSPCLCRRRLYIRWRRSQELQEPLMVDYVYY